MPENALLFHMPLHYLPKVALRLEHLLTNVIQASNEAHPIIHHYALQNIIEIIKIAEKPELKGRFLKEFIRIEHKLKKDQGLIDNKTSHHFYNHIHSLNQMTGHFGLTISHDAFIQSIRFSQTSQKDDADFTCPQLHYWLTEASSKRQQDLTQWSLLLKNLMETVFVYLTLLRKTASTETINLLHGFYQYPITDQKICQIIQVKIDKKYKVVPKTQLSHHGLSIRLYNASSMQEVQQHNVQIELAFCRL